jgi:hypothetical protein
MKSQTFIQIV